MGVTILLYLTKIVELIGEMSLKILFGEYTARDVKRLFSSMAKYIINWEGDVPGATPKECGNYLDHNLHAAQIYMKKWLRVITANKIGYDQFTYPKK